MQWAALRILFDDISFCRYRVIFKISLKYHYRIFLLRISHDIYDHIATIFNHEILVYFSLSMDL